MSRPAIFFSMTHYSRVGVESEGVLFYQKSVSVSLEKFLARVSGAPGLFGEHSERQGQTQWRPGSSVLLDVGIWCLVDYGYSLGQEVEK